jgi:hypothetical protein
MHKYFKNFQQRFRGKQKNINLLFYFCFDIKICLTRWNYGLDWGGRSFAVVVQAKRRRRMHLVTEIKKRNFNTFQKKIIVFTQL